jgi:hypothetical protein
VGWGEGGGCWGFGWWADPGGEPGLAQCYGADQYGKTQTLAVLFTTRTNTLSIEHTHTHTHTKCATKEDTDKLLNCVSFLWSTNKRKQRSVGYAR